MTLGKEEFGQNFSNAAENVPASGDHPGRQMFRSFIFWTYFGGAIRSVLDQFDPVIAVDPVLLGSILLSRC